MKKAIYRMDIDFRRGGSLTGIFCAEIGLVEKLIKDEVELYFGEVMGKHSDINGSLSEEDITMVTDDKVAVDVFEKYNLASGLNPLDYAQDEEVCEVEEVEEEPVKKEFEKTPEEREYDAILAAYGIAAFRNSMETLLKRVRKAIVDYPESRRMKCLCIDVENKRLDLANIEYIELNRNDTIPYHTEEYCNEKMKESAKASCERWDKDVEVKEKIMSGEITEHKLWK